MKIFNTILEKHTKMNTCRDLYLLNEDIEITVEQKENKIVMWAFNHTTNRFVSLGTKRFKKLIEGFKLVSSDLYFKNNYCYVTLDTATSNDAVEDKSNEFEIDVLRQKVDFLNDIILSLEESNKNLEKDVNKYREDYLYYHGEWYKLMDKDFKMSLEDIEGMDKNSFKHNARGAGRKAKFNDTQIEEIKNLREEDYTIKEIANRFNCSVGLIHKLINEKR